VLWKVFHRVFAVAGMTPSGDTVVWSLVAWQSGEVARVDLGEGSSEKLMLNVGRDL
jgi:hypothetical protein